MTTTCGTHEEARSTFRRPALLTAMGLEWRLLSVDLGWWIALAALSASTVLALSNGWHRVRGRAASVQEAKEDETRRVDTLVRQLKRIERGEGKLPDAPYRDPRNAIYVGRGQGATVAYLPDGPLAALSIGLSDLYPRVFKVNAGSKDGFLFLDEPSNPANLLAGGFDVAFVIVHLYPLFLIVTCYNVYSREAEQGTLALTRASSARLSTILAGKLLVRGGLLSLVLAVILIIGLAVIRAGGTEPSPSPGAIVLLVGSLLSYGAFWGAVALGVNSLRRDSAFNVVACVGAWVVLMLVIPSAINALAQVAYPAPARSEMILAVREAAVDAERDRDAAEARYREEHPSDVARPKTATVNDERTRRTLDVTLRADIRADAVLVEQNTKVRNQRRLSDRVAVLAPPALANDILAELAGAGHTQYDQFLERVELFHQEFRGFFVDRARRETALTAEDYAHFPRFAPSYTHTSLSEPSLRRILTSLTWLTAFTLALLVVSLYRIDQTE
ncbi:MAG: DUF3526 domain-containing protein [Isosphaeraceae bacterium]